MATLNAIGTPVITLGDTFTMTGAFPFVGNLTAATNVTFPTSGTLATTAGTVSSVSGTANRITSTAGVNPVIDISVNYVGQTSITTLGTIATGVWQGTIISPTYGGTGVNNGSRTITLGGSLSTVGAFTSTFTMTANTSVTFPTSGTLATTASGSVTTGLINQLAWYAAAGTAVSGLTIVNSAVLTTTAGGVPTWVAYTGTGAPVLGTSPTITTPRISQINDSVNSLPALAITASASAVNYLSANAQVTGSGPNLSAVGSDTDIALNLLPKGTGPVQILSANLTVPLIVTNGTSRQHITNFTFPNTAASRDVTFPDASGTVQLQGQSLGAATATSITFSPTTGGNVGTTTNNNASAGIVGEVVSSSVAVTSVNLSSSAVTTITSISITAGDWDVVGNVGFSPTAGCIITQWYVAISQANNTLPATNLISGWSGSTTPSAIVGDVAPCQRISTASTITLYLVTQATFNTQPLAAGGTIYARRAR